MPNSFHVDSNTDGSFTAQVTTGAGAINWASLLTWITTYGPNVIAAVTALITIFGAPTPPVPVPTPAPASEPSK